MATKILVVDDEITKLTPLVDALAKEGYEVDGVEDGITALNKIEKTKYDIVITDIRLPELDGIELLKRIREISKETEVIVITAYTSIDSAVSAMKAGAYDYISKPFSIEDILGKVKEISNKKITI